MLSVEATNTNFIVFGLIESARLSGVEPMIYRTPTITDQDYTTDTVPNIIKIHSI